MSLRISAADHALCQAAARELRKAHPFVHGRPPLAMTNEQHALRRDYRSLSVLAAGDLIHDPADYQRRLELAQRWAPAQPAKRGKGVPRERDGHG